MKENENSKIKELLEEIARLERRSEAMRKLMVSPHNNYASLRSAVAQVMAQLETYLSDPANLPEGYVVPQRLSNAMSKLEAFASAS